MAMVAAATRRRLFWAVVVVLLTRGVEATEPCRAMLLALALRGGNVTSFPSDPQQEHYLAPSSPSPEDRGDVLVAESFVDKMLLDDDGVFSDEEGEDRPQPPSAGLHPPSLVPPPSGSSSGDSVVARRKRPTETTTPVLAPPIAPAPVTASATAAATATALAPDTSVSARVGRAPGSVRFFGTPVSSFKGFGLSLEKSIVKMAACGVAVKIPITAHFPEYDKNQNYPRLSGSVGITYPKGYKVSVSANFNVQTALTKLLAVCDAAGVHGAGAWMEKLRKQQASASSVKRVGATFSLRYTDAEKYSFTVEPWVSYIPGLDVMKQYVLPVLLVLPAAAVAALGVVIPLPLEEEEDGKSRMGDDGKDAGNPDAQAAAAAAAVGANSTKAGRVVKRKSRTTTLAVSDEPGPAAAASRKRRGTAGEVATSPLSANGNRLPAQSKNARKTITKKYARGRGVRRWHRQLVRWAVTKTCWLGMDLGSRYRTLFDASKSSRIYFEVAPFFPLAKTMKRAQVWLAGRPSGGRPGQWRAELWRWLGFGRGLPPEPLPEPDAPDADEGVGVGGDEHSWHEDVEWLPEMSRLGPMTSVDEAAAAAAPREPILPATGFTV